ncbi:MAG: dTDP-4-dehydrorhamnose 3,5-epimerase [Winogradskyella sp.]|uniref:dTDP-4-dehydrorhamnose 3,5-epimerase n=1 Tax=Winogradskyella sp. TaxID=1883156 RepID=UPI000F3BBB0B|nr:dTDP-4-dehydrorhamnose 3,5-epimerase [Winogradskyella sp.]RNC88164.1 MAG: dTDP-4-dehydrorhamnose 3,5-epimerase [Winogradskyella sp.]
MRAIETELKGCFIIEPPFFKDNRGYFFESFNQKKFNDAVGNSTVFVQDNQSYSTKGVIRGLHFQKGDFAQAKLVRVTQGKVIDVAVDLRRQSSTYGKHISIELSENNKKQLFIPRGFAHGFAVLSDFAVFQYKCDNYYNKDAEAGLIYNDQDLNIDWMLNKSEIIVSEKDLKLQSFKSFNKLF